MTTLDVDILHPSKQQEASKNKKKTLIPNPRSEFLQLTCKGCQSITTAFSHSNVPITCSGCNQILATPTGGRIKLSDGVESRSRTNA